MSWMTLQWAALCATVRGSLLVFCASLWVELQQQQPVSSCGCSAQNATPATPSGTGFSWWLTLCVCWLLLYMLFMGSQIVLGVLFWNVVFRHCRVNVSGCIHIYCTKSKRFESHCISSTLCTCVFPHSVNQKLYSDLITKLGIFAVKNVQPDFMAICTIFAELYLFYEFPNSWMTYPNPTPKPMCHWCLDKLYNCFVQISYFLKYVRIGCEIALECQTRCRHNYWFLVITSLTHKYTYLYSAYSTIYTSIGIT